eukprot:714533-Alexandrium_andersonii.AAC.1
MHARASHSHLTLAPAPTPNPIAPERAPGKGTSNSPVKPKTLMSLSLWPVTSMPQPVTRKEAMR